VASEAGDWWVLLHGTPLTPAVWDGVAAHLRPAGRVLCPDLTLAGDAPGTADAQTELAAGLASAKGGLPERMHLVGHSFGAQVALDLALLIPDRVQTVTVICSRDTPYPPFAAAAAAVRQGGPDSADATLARWFTVAERQANGAAVRYARDCLQNADRQSWAAALDAIARYDRAGRVAGIGAPVTLIAAALDPISTPAAMSALAGRLPRASLTVLPGAAHMSPFTDPAALAALLPGVRGS
jgi:pimeloyl-ACP methyl ester carboxylesterase